MKIESGIAIPNKTWERESKYPIKDMKIGDSIFFPNKKYKRTSVTSAFTSYRAKHTDFAFVVRTINGKGFRIWRVPVAKKK